MVCVILGLQPVMESFGITVPKRPKRSQEFPVCRKALCQVSGLKLFLEVFDLLLELPDLLLHGLRLILPLT